VARVPGLLIDRAEAIRRIAEDCGPLVRVPVPGKTFHLVSCPRWARQVLLTNNKNYRKSFDWKIVHSLLGDGLVTSHDEVWRHTRSSIAPAFRADPVARMAPALSSIIAEEVAGWRRPDGVLNVSASSTRLALRCFTRAALDVDADGDLSTIAETVATSLRHLDARLAALVDFKDALPTPGRWRFRRALARLDAVVYRWLDERAARAPGSDLLSLLLQASAKVPAPRRWLRDQVVTFLLAGHETVGVSLTWSLYLLAKHRDVQARLRAANDDDLERWGELDAVIHECLRLYPPVWSLGREAVAADRFGDFEVPAGSTVMVSPYAIHRRADLWPEPDAFRPERFRDGPPRQSDDALTWLPFSAGPRYCPGDRMALLELKLALREVLRRHDVSLLSDAPVPREALISLRPKRDLLLRVVPL
jgi:cytochrome P450